LALTILTVIIPIRATSDIALLIGFAPAAYCTLLCVCGAILSGIGFIIGFGITEPTYRG
jgi:hypothetical protein